MIGGPAVPFLKSCLKDKREFVRCLAAETLGEIGEEAVEAVEEIKDALSDENRQVVLHSIMALSSIGEKARAALPKLRGLLRSIDPYIKEAAEEAIEKIAAKK